MQQNDEVRALARELLKLKLLWLQELRAAEKEGRLINWMTRNVNTRYECLPKEGRINLKRQAQNLLEAAKCSNG